jgi:hypothetical protein
MTEQPSNAPIPNMNAAATEVVFSEGVLHKQTQLP